MEAGTTATEAFSHSGSPKDDDGKFFWWHKPGTSKREKKLVQKLDLCLLTYCCLAFFAKDLDRNNVSNAYVSGMKEELGLEKNELNWFTTYYQIGYIVGQIPSNILLTKISPRIYLSGADFLWSFLVLFLYKVKNAEQVYILRFFIGLVEATCWPGLHFMIGSWYRNHEINKRAGIFTAAGIAATMFDGYIQAGIYKSANGHLGLAGWRWLFIVDFLITCPMAAIGYFLIPNPPNEKKSWWMTDEEYEMCKTRLEADDRRPLGKFDRTLFKRVFGRWHFWVMCTMFSFVYFTYQAPTQSTMQLYLKAKGHSVEKINNLPTVYAAVSIVYMLASGVWNDWRRSQIESLILICVVCITAECILVAWDVSEPAKYFAFWISGVIQAAIPIVVSWTHHVCSKDAEERAIVVASLNAIGVAQGTWWNQVFVPTVEAPVFKRGYRASLAASLAMTAWLPVVWLFDRMQKKKEKTELEAEMSITSSSGADVSGSDQAEKNGGLRVRTGNAASTEDGTP